ncbi:hypothetical protein HNQ07_000618 [Deinococcus metalli]|uniref:Uncharacterized protein n=1 Tax=Deinococcus metalli TaxID=1141878 RepID=A0A7W8KBI6_9DEIO|nr:hypothetical protein [Deinococcus metalli]MBB5375174.1 hypothetical protein [Deinococcus metalli]GHF31186.1 hypothetical protein GCM10017781_04240 [Deinococcus metalli]
MKSSPQPTTGAPERERWGVSGDAGRWPTLAVLIALFAVSVTPTLGALVRGQDAHLASSIPTAIGTALLLGLVWRGHVWAWRVTVGLSMLAGLLVFVVGMLAALGGPAGWVVSGAGIAYLLLGTALVGTPVIRAFLDRRWAARKGRP